MELKNGKVVQNNIIFINRSINEKEMDIKNKFKIAIVQTVRYPFDYDKNTQRCKKSYNFCLSQQID